MVFSVESNIRISHELERLEDAAWVFFYRGYGADIRMGLEFVDINISRERGLGLNISYGCRWRNNPTVQ